MGLTWNPDFIRSVPGMAQAGQVAFSFLGGIVNIFFTNGLLGFAFWAAFFISGFLLLCHICNMAQSIEASFAYFTKVVSVFDNFYLYAYKSGRFLSGHDN